MFLLVTGASSGIGRQIAITLSQQYCIVLCGRNRELLEETMKLCKNKAMIWQYDLKEISSLSGDLSNFIKSNDIAVSGFVHSAGIAPLSSLRLLGLDQMTDIWNVNFASAAIILKTLTNHRVNGKNLRRVIFISSIQSQLGAKGQSVYCASKGALESFCRAMAEELAPRVCLNVIRPGAIETPMGKQLADGAELLSKNLDNGYLLGLGHTQDIANMAEYLMSDKAGWMTGQCINVDGGRTAH